MKSELKDRVLWFDGTSQVDPEQVPTLLLEGVHPENIVVTHHNEDTKQFNLLADAQILDVVDLENWVPDTSWKIPQKYLNIDVEQHLKNLLDPRYATASYTRRLAAEIIEIRERKLEPLFQALIYVVDTFREKSVIWGVGRGSSCASLALFLIGIHRVDPVKYDIPLEEFFHD